MRYEQRLIWVLGITFGFLFFDRNAASFLMPFIARDLSFTNQQVGLIASALSFTWAVSAFLGGALSDHTGRRNMILCVLMSIFMVAWMVLGWAFLPLFYVKVRQLSAGEMSVLMSLLGLSAAFFSFVVPGLSDRLGRRPVVAGCSLLGLLVP